MQKTLIKLCIIIYILFISSCGMLLEQKNKKIYLSVPELYTKAKKELSIGAYYQAILYLKKIESFYPSDIYAQQAQIDIAYAYYRLNDQVLALSTINRFINLYPYHSHIDYMYYLQGLIYFHNCNIVSNFFINQNNTDRNQNVAHNAFNTFKLLIELFPNSVYKSDAIFRMKYLLKVMADYEMHIAKYYFCRGVYIAAINRAQDIIKQYPDTLAVKEALYLIMYSYKALGQINLMHDVQRVINMTYLENIFSWQLDCTK